MHCLSVAVLAAVAHLASIVFATPQGFSVSEQSMGRRKLRSGPIAVEAAYLKYKKTVPASIKAAAKAAKAASGGQGSVTATPEYNEEYLCPVSIGTPPQTLMMNFDTTSGDLCVHDHSPSPPAFHWVFSSELPSNEKSGHSVYTPGYSSTSSLLVGETWGGSMNGYGESGNIYTDIVDIGGVVARSQAVECAESVSSTDVSNTDSDGVVGLAFDSDNTARPQKVATFFDNVESLLTLPLFTAYLHKGKPGSYDFGYIDSTKYQGTLTYAGISTANGFWEFSVTGYAVGSFKMNLGNLDCIADTAMPLTLLPGTILENYYSKVKGASLSSTIGGYIFPCSSSLPSLSLIIGGSFVTIPGTYINYTSVNSKDCYGGLQSNSGLGFGILGQTFFQSQFVVFNVGNQEIGFATQKPAA